MDFRIKRDVFRKNTKITNYRNAEKRQKLNPQTGEKHVYKGISDSTKKLQIGNYLKHKHLPKPL